MISLRRLWKQAGASLLLGMVLSFVGLQIDLGYLDSAFLDFRQNLFPKKLHSSDLLSVSVSPDKNGHEWISAPILQSRIEELSKFDPKKIIIALGASEIRGSDAELNSLYDYLKSNPKVALFSLWGRSKNASFEASEFWRKFDHLFIVKQCEDNKLGGKDGRIRRFLVSMDGKNIDLEHKKFYEEMGLSEMPIGDYPGTFKLFDSVQFYLRYYYPDSVPHGFSDSLSAREAKNRYVFVGSTDGHASFSKDSVLGRFWLNSHETLQYSLFAHDYALMAFENIRNLDYIRAPSKIGDFVWITLLLLLWFLQSLLLDLLSLFSFL